LDIPYIRNDICHSQKLLAQRKPFGLQHGEISKVPCVVFPLTNIHYCFGHFFPPKIRLSLSGLGWEQSC
jgi:hypothetical protein